MARTQLQLRTLSVLAMLMLLTGNSATPQEAAAQITRTRNATGGDSARLAPPNERPGKRRWMLGITAETTEIGVRVRDVLARTPAERAGLERGDLIVSVDGYQVGRVGGREYPLDQELDARADSSGRVRLLVQNRRNNQLTNIDVRLEVDRPDAGPGPGPGRRTVSVTGEAVYRDRAALPRNAELRVKVSRRKILGSETLVEKTFAARGQAAIPFDLRFEVDRDDWDRTCEVSAEIHAEGRRIYVDDGSQRFKPSESPIRLKIDLRRS